MTLFPVYLLVLVVFANRYFAGLFFKHLRPSAFEPADDEYEPTVTVVVPLYNEGEGIYRTIKSLLEQDYPRDKLEIIVIDDCSTDDSHQWACRAAEECPDNVKVLRNPTNVGKRRGIIHAVRESRSEIIVSVDSDVIVEKNAIKRLVRRFVRPELAAVGGRVNISNANDGWLTRIQAIKYYFCYEYLKNLERAFSSVMCLSGCLTAYRRSVLIELEPILERRNILGIPITYGEDRYLTRQVVKAGYQTTNTLDAICWTVAPDTVSKYFSQQLRWRRSNFVDFLLGLSHAWKLHPIVAVHYLSLFAMLVVYPLIIAQNILQGTFWELAAFHLLVSGAFGAIYYFDTRTQPPSTRVHPLWFLGMAAIMPVTYLIFTPLAMFTLDSSSWETRSHRPTETGDGVAEGALEPRPVFSLAALRARLAELKTSNMVFRLNKFIVSVYKAIGFAVLTLVVVGLASYIGLQIFYFVNHGWVAPAVISPSDPRVQDAYARLAQQSVVRDRLLSEKLELESRIENDGRIVLAEEDHQERLRVAVEQDSKARASELSKVRSLVENHKVAEEDINQANRAYANMSRERLSELFATHIIDQDGLLNGNYQLSQIAHSNLSLAEQRVTLQTRIDALSRELRSLQQTGSDLGAVTPKSTNAISYETLRIHHDFVQSTLELERAKGERDALRRSIESIDREVGEYGELIASIENDPLLKAARQKLLVAFVPYDNLENIRVGQPIFGCRFQVLWCKRVGTVLEILEGEKSLKHPLHNYELRGLFVRIQVDDNKWAEKVTLFADRAPLLI